MREFRIFYVVLTVLTFAMCFIYQSRLMPVILLILLICPVLSFVIMIFNFFMLKIDISPTELVAEKLEENFVKINLTNRFLIPASPVKIIGDFQGGEESGFSKKILLTDAAPFATADIMLPFKLPFRGEYTVRIYEVCVYDLLKLFKLRKKLDICSKITIIPREKTPDGIGTQAETDKDSLASVISGNKSNIFNSLREYREGDNIRQIHWKLTAKQDELIVKQMEQSINNSAVIFSDFSVKLENESLSRRMIDAVLETSLAITKQILLDGNSAINCWQGAYGPEKYELTEFLHYSYLYNAFTVLPGEPSERGFDELVTLFSGEINEHHAVYLITPGISGELLKTLEDTGFATRGGVTLVMFKAVWEGGEIEEYISERTNLKIAVIDDEQARFYVE